MILTKKKPTFLRWALTTSFEVCSNYAAIAGATRATGIDSAEARSRGKL